MVRWFPIFGKRSKKRRRGGRRIDWIPNGDRNYKNSMDRICSKCRSPLHDQPALEDITGPLCFPCRWRFDKAGGQSFVLKMKEYETARALWERMYSKQWDQFHEKKSLAERYNLTAWGLTIGAFFSLVFFQSLELVIVLFIGAGVSWLYYQDARTVAEMLRCDPPPKPPEPDLFALSARPRLFFDASYPRVGSPDYDIFVGSYPPDWDVRREFVLKRDSHRCRLCGSTKNLQVHHVWPVSYSSNHTPQNLITLCSECHMKQEYWRHKYLVMESRKANTKYFVPTYTRTDGTVVRGHMRRVGRRGKFWQHVKAKRRRFESSGSSVDPLP